MYNPYSLSGKTILVTGASSGIGKATAVECSRLGAKLILVGRNKERLEETFSQLEGEGHIMRILDLTDVDALEMFVKELPEIHGCVNNAGIGGKLINLIYYFTVNKVIASQFTVVGNKKVTVMEFICMLPQIISLGTSKGM